MAARGCSGTTRWRKSRTAHAEEHYIALYALRFSKVSELLRACFAEVRLSSLTVSI